MDINTSVRTNSLDLQSPTVRRLHNEYPKANLYTACSHENENGCWLIHATKHYSAVLKYVQIELKEVNTLTKNTNNVNKFFKRANNYIVRNFFQLVGVCDGPLRCFPLKYTPTRGLDVTELRRRCDRAGAGGCGQKRARFAWAS